MRVHFTFDSDRFNLSEEKEHFINPCCFGEDLAAWLKNEFEKRSYEANQPDQEDWGWYLEVKFQGQWYFLAMSGASSDLGDNPDLGEWRIIVEKQRGLMEKLRGRNKLESDDPVISELDAILSAQADFANVGRESESA